MDLNNISSSNPRVLFYNKFFGKCPDISGLPNEERRHFTWNREHYPNVEAVVFHIPDLAIDVGDLSQLGRLKKSRDQIWVAWFMESTVNYPILQQKDFRAKFDLTISYERDADIWAPYLPGESAWSIALDQSIPIKKGAAPIVLFQSSPFNSSRRIEFVLELMRFIRIDSYGKILQNSALEGGDDGPITKMKTISKYPFCLSLENSIAKDYVTEKFYDPLLAGTVPVYKGAPNIDQFTPGVRAFVDASLFSSPQRLAHYMTALSRNYEAYQSYHQWRKLPLMPAFLEDVRKIRINPFSKLLMMLDRRL